MDLDDELRQLFTSDRLDVPVRADAEEIIVAGARRVRRRRIAAATASGAVAVVAVVAAGVALAGGDPDAMPPATTNPTTPTDQSSVNAGPPSVSTDTGTSTVNTATSTSSPAKPTTSRTKTTDPGPPKLNFLVVGPTGLRALELGQSLADAQATGLLGDRTSEGNGCAVYELLADDRVGGGLVYVTDTVQVIAAYPVKTPEGVGRGWTIAQVKDVYPDLDEDAAESGVAVVPVAGNASASFRLHFAEGVVNSVTLELDGQSCI